MSISLTQPSVGSTGWGNDVNQNFQTIQDALNGAQDIGPINLVNGAGSYLRVPQLTTAQRDSLTAVNGMIIYNTTTAQFERYQAGAWGAFNSGSAYATVQEEGSDLTQRTKLNFIGNAITAADDSGNARTNVTLSQSPSGSTSVVGTGRTLNTSEGVQGGGDLSADRTLKLDVNGLTEDTTPDGSADFVPTYDTSASTHKKVKPVNMPAFTGDSGSGGVRGQVPAPAAGDAAANKFLKADGTWSSTPVNAYSTVQEEGSDLTQRNKLNFIGAAITAADDAGNSRTNVTLSQSPGGSASVVGTGRQVNTSEGVQGGGDLSADRTLKLDVNGLTEDTTPDGSSDFVPTYDASAATHKKVKPVNLPAFTGDSGAGGVRGQVPAPASGDAAAGKFLKADGTWATTPVNAYSTVQEEGSDLTQRSKLNFVGSAITAADDSGNARTNVTLSQSPGGSTSVVGTGRQVSTSEGVQGGGDLSADRTLKLNVNGLTEDTTPDGSADFIPTYDASAATHKKVKPINLPAFTGDSGSGGVRGQVPAPSSGDAAAGKFLKADGTWTAPSVSGYATVQEEGSDLTQRSKLNFIGSALTAADDAGNARTNVTLSQSPGGSTSIVGTGRQVSTSEGVQGGGDLSADRTLKLDINGLTEDTTPDGSNDFVATYDASAATHKKVKPVNMPAFTGDSGSGGVRGQVPAPAAGDAAAGKYLKADGTWTAPSSGGTAALQRSDKELTPWPTYGDAYATGLQISNTPNASGYVMVGLNGVQADLGNGVTTKDCHFLSAAAYRVPSGGDHALFLKTDRTAYAWGANGAGQVGDNSTSGRSSPVAVSAGGMTFAQIAAGKSHNIAVRGSDSTCWAWGLAASGQVGDNQTATNRSSPVSVVGAHSFSLVAGGGQHSLGQKSNGTLWAWGLNSSGQDGDNSTTTRSSPVSVVGSHVFSSFYGGNAHSVGLKADGTAWCWGTNANGQLGDNSTTTRSSPVSVVGSHAFVALATYSGDHTLAIKSDGTCWAWGLASSGQIGDNQTATNRSSPVSVVGAHSFIQVAAGPTHSLGLKSDGTCWAWGSNGSGEVGDNSATGRSSPVSVVGAHSFIQVATGLTWSMGVKADGSVWSWGINSSGQLGDNSTTNRSSPVSVVVGTLPTVRAWNAIQANDFLIWNGRISNLDLRTSARIDLGYI